MRRVFIYLALAGLCGLIGGVGLSGELGANVYETDGVVTGTHTSGSGASRPGHIGRTYWVDVRTDTYDEYSLHNAPLYDAVHANKERQITLEITDVGNGVERVSHMTYLGRTYTETTKSEGVGVAIAFFVLTALFLFAAVRRWIRVRRRPAPVI
jgi:hypothetical protein